MKISKGGLGLEIFDIEGGRLRLKISKAVAALQKKEEVKNLYILSLKDGQPIDITNII